MELGRIAKHMKLKFSVIMDDPIDRVQNSFRGGRFISRYVKDDGSEFTTVNPHPFITIDISKTMDIKSDDRASDFKVNMNQYAKMKLEMEIEKMIRIAIQQKNLFLINANKNLIINQKICRMYDSLISLGNKSCLLQFTVVKDDNGQEYEGIIFTIKETANFCYLTMTELQLLLYTLRSVNMPSLIMQVLTYYETIKSTNYKTHEELNGNLTSSSVQPKMIVEPKPKDEIIEIGRLPVSKTSDNILANLGI